MASNFVQHASTGCLEFGIMGSVTSIPAGFSISLAIFAGNMVTDTVREFGHAMLKYFDTSRLPADITLTKLGYSTDNGAYYYYNTPNGTTFESELSELQQESAKQVRLNSYILSHSGILLICFFCSNFFNKK
jgi:hypothetical protein